MVILHMALEMAGQIGDTLGQNGNLHFGRTRIACVGGMELDEFLLAFWRNRHRNFLSDEVLTGPAVRDALQGRAGMSSSTVSKNERPGEIPVRCRAYT